MAQNRLQLDWGLEWKEDRVRFAHDYLDAIEFAPTSEELDMIGKYILWGKSKQTGLNGKQEGLELETRAKTWDAEPLQSLDALLESPAFNENSLRPNYEPPTKITKQNFSRSEARANAPDATRAIYEELWRRIDEVEILTSFYDLKVGKRKAPIRETLLSRFTNQELEKLEKQAQELQNFKYLKLRHELVELRREQYTLRDSYQEPIGVLTRPAYSAPDTTNLGVEVEVSPIPLFQQKDLWKKIFREDRFPEPGDFGEKDLEFLAKVLWKKTTKPNKDEVESLPAFLAPDTIGDINARDTKFFDFCNTDHLYALFAHLQDLEDEAESLEGRVDSLVVEFLDEARTYVSLAPLEPIHRLILELKIEKKSNQEIVDRIKAEFGKEYKANYISTLYCKKCIETIAQTAALHREVVENLCFPENFKKCKDCGRVLLMTGVNFVKRQRSNDGYSPRCKVCEKIKRNREDIK